MKNLFIIFLVVLSNTSFCQNFEKLFEIEVAKEGETLVNLISDSDSWSLYKMANTIDAYNQMYIATQNPDYLVRAMKIELEVIKTAKLSRRLTRSQFKDQYLGWANMSHPEKGNDGLEYPLYESYFWRYATSTLVLASRIVYLKQTKEFSRIFMFSKNHVYDKWLNRGKNNIFRSTTNMSALWAHIGLNLWLLTDNLEYKNNVIEFCNRFSELVVERKDGSIYWPAYFEKSRNKFNTQDVSHANAEVSFIIDACDAGVYFDRRIIDKLVITLDKYILKGNNIIALYIDGDGKDYGNRKIVDGFMKLGRFNEGLKAKLAQTFFINNSEYFKRSQYIAVQYAIQKIKF